MVSAFIIKFGTSISCHSPIPLQTDLWVEKGRPQRHRLSPYQAFSLAVLEVALTEVYDQMVSSIQESQQHRDSRCQVVSWYKVSVTVTPFSYEEEEFP